MKTCIVPSVLLVNTIIDHDERVGGDSVKSGSHEKGREEGRKKQEMMLGNSLHRLK